MPVPVIGSGDIFSAEDALVMLTRTGCDAVMIGRGSYGNPWLIRDILARMGNSPLSPPTLGDRLTAINLHFDLFLTTFGPRKAVRDLRKHLAWYSRGLPGAAQFRSDVMRLQSIEEIRSAVAAFFTSTEESAG